MGAAMAGEGGLGNLLVLVAGPTCSGKSALAMAMAEHLGGTVINADSMQVYAELRILTARPSPADEARVPHALYGHQPAAVPGSVALWRRQAVAAIEAARAGGRVPILCGGTGLYFAALTQGLADIPEPGDAVRREARDLLASEGAAALHARLAEADPRTAARLRLGDGQRVARAWEVWRGTGIGLAQWQDEASRLAVGDTFRAVMINPPRADLRDAIEHRFAAMLKEGAVEEAEALLRLGLDPALPAMRAHGVPELTDYLRGRASLEEASRRACLATGQYTKRQGTWFRNRPLCPPAATFSINTRIITTQQFMQSGMADMQHFLQLSIDAAQHAS